MVILLHRKAYYAERKPEAQRSAEDWSALRSREATLVVDKARGGMRRKLACSWTCLRLPSGAGIMTKPFEIVNCEDCVFLNDDMPFEAGVTIGHCASRLSGR